MATAGRLTDLPSLTRGLPRTSAGALEALRRYEAANPDLDPQLRRLMALGACQRFGRWALEQATGTKLPRLPFRDHAWRYWQALDTSGLGEYWGEFKRAAVGGGPRAACQMLRQRVSPDAYRKFLQRLGTNPHNSHKPIKNVIWTKGGTWRRESRLTQLLVLHQHLERVPLLKWHRKIMDRLPWLESELWGLVNPDRMLSVECKELAVDYSRKRLSEMLYRKKRVGLPGVAWFLQQPIPMIEHGRPMALVPNLLTGYVHRRAVTNVHQIWEW